MNKRGFELALNTIIILILAVFVLLFAVMFFTTGSANFIDYGKTNSNLQVGEIASQSAVFPSSPKPRQTPHFSVEYKTEGFGDIIKGYFSYSNADSIVQRCNIFADSNSLNSFCCEKVEVKYYRDDKKIKGMFSCKGIFDNGIDNRVKSLSCVEAKC